MPNDQVEYIPDVALLSRTVARIGAGAILVVEEPDDRLVEDCRTIDAELRFTTEGSAMKLSGLLPVGLYTAWSHGRWCVVVKPGAAASGAKARVERLAHISDDWDPLVIARDLAEDFWISASEVSDEDTWPAGTHVLIVGTNDVGRVVSHRRLSNAVQYTVDVRGVHKTVTSTNLQQLPGDLNEPRIWMSLPPANAEEIALTIAWTKLHHPLSDVLYSFQASRTLFRPYQFKPVLKLIESDEHRLLIADEVGLGKTIEAGLIWSELEGRNPLDRVLILCPAALTTKWATEMDRRFDRKVRLLSQNDWGEFFGALERGESAPLLGIESIERLRMSEVVDRIVGSGVRFDLVVIDEAHKLRNPGTATHDLGLAIADAADALVLLTATPVNLGNRDLFTLLGLLDEGRFNDQAAFELESAPNANINAAAALLLDPSSRPRDSRNALLSLGATPIGASILSRPDTKELLSLLDTDQSLTPREIAWAKRTLSGLGTFSDFITRTRKVDVPDAKAVRSAHTLKVQWTDEEHSFYQAVRRWVSRKASQDGTPPGFAEQMPLRQTASCIPAMVQRLRLQSEGQATEVEDDYLAEFGILLPDLDPEAEVVVPQLNCPIPKHDTKFDIFLEALESLRNAGLRQSMVFSYFRLTLGYLHTRLEQIGISNRVMHGGVSLDDRDQIMADFRAGLFDILLISEVGSEGLDFEFCGALVNYDLPWNPMRVEQRIGRLDRFGQKHEKILIYNFAVEDTIEDRVLLRLYERIGVFERSIGELEPIIAREIEDLAHLLADSRLSTEEQWRRAHEIEVALSEKEAQIERLRASEGSLTQLDRVLIDGFELDNPGRGRFVGARELELLLADLAARTEGAVKLNPSHRVLELSGTPKLAAKLRDHLRREAHPNPGSLIQRIQDRTPVQLALVPDEATSATQLLTVRHPLLRVAVHEIEIDPLGLKRFGHISLSSHPSATYFALLTLVEGVGLKGYLRIEPTVVDAQGVQSIEVEDELLQAFSAGTVSDGHLAIPANLVALHESAQRLADVARLQAEQELQMLAASLTAARRASLRHSTQIKVRAAEERLRSASDHRIIRMHQGRIRNLQEYLQVKLQELERSPSLVTGEQIAVLIIDR